jgi:hypothetical protein
VRHWVVIAAVLLPTLYACATPHRAWAQIDPRLAPQTVAVLQSVLALRDAQLKAAQEDYEKRIEELKTLCGDPCKEKARDP